MLRVPPSFQADFRCQDLLSLGRCCKSTRQGPFRSTFCSTRSSKPSDLLDRVLKTARQGPFRSIFCSTGSSKPPDSGRSDHLSARQCPRNRPTGNAQINALLARVLKTSRQPRPATAARAYLQPTCGHLCHSDRTCSRDRSMLIGFSYTIKSTRRKDQLLLSVAV